MKKDTKKLSPKEEKIMSLFWQEGAMSVRDVLDKMENPKPHFNTVSTFIRGLEAKGWLSHEAIGNSFRYFPIVDASEWKERSLGTFVERFFGRSYLRFVSSLVEEEKVSTEELRLLVEELENQKRESSCQQSADREKSFLNSKGTIINPEGTLINKEGKET